MKHLISSSILAILSALFIPSVSAQSLSAGDIAIIGYNYDASPQEMAIVVLAPISAGTIIRITDYGYYENTGIFGEVSTGNNSVEGAIQWTVTSGIAAGTVIKFSIATGATPTVSGLPGVVSVTGWTSLTATSSPVGAGGDNWFIYQGSSATSVTNFIFAWTNPFATTYLGVNQPAGQFNVTGSGSPNLQNSYLPPSLTLGLNAIALNRNGGYHGDNNVYTGVRSGTKANILADICNPAKWLTNETTTYDLSVGGAYFTESNPVFTVTSLATWDGSTSTDWNVASNWSNDTVPTALRDVYVPDVSGASNNFPMVSTIGAVARGVTMDLASSLTIGNGGELTLHGPLQNNGQVTVAAGEFAKGSLITLGSVGGSGTFTAQKFLKGSGDATPNGVFHYVTPSVAGATAAAYDLISGNKLWSADETIQEYTQITNEATALQVGEGYAVRMGTTGVVSVSGASFATGDITYNALSRTGNGVNAGYHLLGNPYPSAVNWATAVKINMEPTIWYRTHSALHVMTVDTYNATSGEGTSNNRCGVEATGIIPSGQGFWTRVAEGSTSGSVAFTNAMRSHGSQFWLYRFAAEEGTVRLNLGNDVASDETILHFTTEAQDTYDDFDSHKMWATNVPQLYTTTGEDSLTINGLYSIETNPIVDLGIKAPTTGNYTITASSITLSEEVWLEDRALNNFQHLNQNPVYAFTTNSGNIGDRFALHFGEMAVVGVAENGTATHVFAADGVVNVSVGNDITTGTITILDMAGRTVQTAAITGSRTVVATDLVTGIYLVRVETEKGGETHRVVVR